MKKYWLVLLILLGSLKGIASHIVGGEVTYTYIGPGSQPGTSKYTVMLRLFTECAQACNVNNVACPPTNPLIGIFVNQPPYSRITNLQLSLLENPQLNLSTFPACLTNPPIVCYKVNTYTAQVELADNSQGYRLAYQSCCRAASQNVVDDNTLSPPFNVPGATYEAILPGTSLVPAGHNSSAIVNLKDTALICSSTPFTLDFGAADSDNDSLSYAFVAAYDGGSFSGQVETNGPDVPTYNNVNYKTGYSGISPLGSGVTINPVTGRISGTAPAAIGRYVVNVIVREWRNGVLIAEHRKDFLIRTNDCSLTKAQLSIVPVTCDGFTVDFSQFNSSSGNITSYYWQFGDPASGTEDTSTLQGPKHKFTDTGVYTIRLKVSSGNLCIDSTSQQIKVYPGFFPDFEVLGQCKNTPIQFRDKTTATYGSVNFWRWNFGDVNSPSNTSTQQNPSHTYTTSGNYNVVFVVASSKGCIDTIPRTISITDRPDIDAGRDTLICSVDTLQLHATGTGNFLWSPNYMISNLTVPDPFVSPDITTDYIVQLTDPFGCSGFDTIRINVVDRVTQSIIPDTTICRTDPIVLHLNSNALYFQWTEIPSGAGTLNSTTIKNPVATPLVNTSYHVVGSIGKCIAQNDIAVKVVPYPLANAGPDITICPGQSAQLNATGGSAYFWSPSAFLNNRNIPNPVSVNPTGSIRYVVSVTDVLGCPKAVRDTVIVIVDRITADAGPSDTSVVLGQPLLLHATGSTHYLWSPAKWLNNIAIPTPVSLPQDNITYTVRVSNDAGCFAEDTIRVHVFFIEPGFYVPNAFTPNGDGKNDRFRPIAIGMKSVDVFRVYNRWGQLLYNSSDMNGPGWDGTFRSKGQDPATYVWYAEGTDYKNNKVRKRGSVVLIRE
ncbi:MAG: PKD domain-containing protein [Ferruginibacter sp.]